MVIFNLLINKIKNIQGKTIRVIIIIISNLTKLSIFITKRDIH